MGMTRIFFATDVHGSETCFRKFLNAAAMYKANVSILSGDITGKLVIPIITKPNGSFSAHYLGGEHVGKSEEDAARIDKEIRSVGFYPYRITDEEFHRLKSQADPETVFRRVVREEIQRWVNEAEVHFKKLGAKCLISPGNDDFFDIDEPLNSSSYIVNPEGKVVNIDDDHEMITMAWSNPTPWNSPRECSEDELASKIEALTSQVSDMKTCIFNFHCPPFDSRLDDAPRLDEKMVARGEMIPVGSKSIRNAIEKHQPLIGLHGHIHESRGSYKIGRTLCVNPGSEYTEGILRGTIVNLDKDSVKGFILTSG